MTCREEGCRARIDWEVSLLELPRKKLSDASREAFVSGNRFKTALPKAGHTLWFKLLTGADERKLPGLRKNAQDRILSAMLALRCVEIEGVEAKDKRRFIEDLSMQDADSPETVPRLEPTGERDRMMFGHVRPNTPRRDGAWTTYPLNKLLLGRLEYHSCHRLLDDRGAH